MWIFLSPNLGCSLSHWLPHTLSAGSACFWGASPHPSPTAAFSSILLSASPNQRHNHPASPAPSSVWQLWPIICTAPKETGEKKKKKSSLEADRFCLLSPERLLSFSLWRLWWINSCAWENRLETRRQVRCAQDRQMETVVSICYRELSEGHNSSHWFLESLICCW